MSDHTACTTVSQNEKDQEDANLAIKTFNYQYYGGKKIDKKETFQLPRSSIIVKSAGKT